MQAQMISAHPQVRGATNDDLVRLIEEAYDCAQVCTSCADVCLAEEMVQQLAQCIRLDLDCADMCMAAGSIGSRRAGVDEALLRKVIGA